MRLLRLQIDGFAGLRTRRIEFGDGITVLLGPNEAGKSTVLHCLAQVLLGKPSQRSLFPDMVPWDGGLFAAAVEFFHEASTYRLTRRFAETGPRAVALHHLGAAGAETLVTQEAGEARKWVAAAFGTADDRIVYRVFCLTQADLSPLDQYTGLQELLERTASGTDLAVSAAVQRVDARIAAHRRGVGQPALQQNWGPLKRATEARRDWEARLHEALRQQRRLQEVREATTGARKRLEEAKARIAEIAAVLEHDQQRRALLARLAELRTLWSAVEGERERLDRLISDRQRFQELMQTLPRAYAEPSRLRLRLAEMERNTSNTPLLGWGLLAVGPLLTIIALAASHYSPLSGLALLLSLLAIPLMWRARRRTQQVRTACIELAVPSLEEAGRRLEAAERYRRELDAITLALERVTDEASVRERRQTTSLDIATVEERIQRIPGTPLTAEAASRLLTEQQTLSASLAAWEEQERALLRELAVLEEAERDVTDLEDGVAYWRAEELRASAEEEACTLARELLLEAGQRAHRAIAGPLSERITPLFAQMTGGRYPGVRAEGDARALHLFPADAAGTPVPVEQLSRGTRDQFTLAVRLALGQVIAGVDGTPIFMLDDPLLHFDADRRAEALAMLHSLSRHTQIIIATHDAGILAHLPGAHAEYLGAAEKR